MSRVMKTLTSAATMLASGLVWRGLGIYCAYFGEMKK